MSHRSKARRIGSERHRGDSGMNRGRGKETVANSHDDQPAPEAPHRATLQNAETLVMASAPRSVPAEKFRRLATTLIQLPESPRAILVTSGVPGEGKSTISWNTALAFANAGESTLLLDADLRRPSIGTYLEPRPGTRLSEVLNGALEWRRAVWSIDGSDVDVLASGESTADPQRLLHGSHVTSLLTELRQQYDRVIIDTPPVVPFADAAQLGPICDGVLMVVRCGVTPESVLADSLELLSASRVLGIVFNDAGIGVLDARYKYDRYYAEYYGRDRGDGRAEPGGSTDGGADP